MPFVLLLTLTARYASTALAQAHLDSRQWTWPLIRTCNTAQCDWHFLFTFHPFCVQIPSNCYIKEISHINYQKCVWKFWLGQLATTGWPQKPTSPLSSCDHTGQWNTSHNAHSKFGWASITMLIFCRDEGSYVHRHEKKVGYWQLEIRCTELFSKKWYD